MKRLGIILAGVLTVGCTAEIKPNSMLGPNGKTAYSMQCSGMGRSLEACYQKAGELCPKGYQVVDQANRTVAITNAVNGQLIMGTQQSLFVECN